MDIVVRQPIREARHSIGRNSAQHKEMGRREEGQRCVLVSTTTASFYLT